MYVKVAVMTKKEMTFAEMNMTIVALVAVVAIVGLVALVMNAEPASPLGQTPMFLGEYELVEERGSELVLRESSGQGNTAGVATTQQARRR